jgi:hypothetical protein
MTFRALWFVSFAAGLLAATAAWADTVAFIDLEIDYFPSSIPSPPDIFPPASQLTGTATFYVQSQELIPQTPIDIGTLGVGGVFSTLLFPPNPCLSAGTCQLDFSFGGMAGGFGAAAFPQGADLSNASPSPPQIMPIGTLDFSTPSPPNVRVAGEIVAFDSPVIVGTWEVTLGVVTPLPAALPLFATGLGALGLFGWRRKRKLAARAAA